MTSSIVGSRVVFVLVFPIPLAVKPRRRAKNEWIDREIDR